MATSQSQQQPAQSPFKLFSRVSWTNRGKKPKQGSLGEENNMYYHPELKRWVERGKEEEAEREAAGPPPPPVMSGASIASAPLSKRSLSQRYALQPNLSISSSMASLAGSLSQTDLAGLIAAGGQGDSFSGPPSAIGSTAPSPPQSSNSLLPQGVFSSGPSSATGIGVGGSNANSFFVPPPPQRATSQPSGIPATSFFVPKPLDHTPRENGQEESAAVPLALDGASTVSDHQQHYSQQAPDDDNTAAAGDDESPEPAGTLGQSPPHDLQRVPHANRNGSHMAVLDGEAADCDSAASPDPPFFGNGVGVDDGDAPHDGDSGAVGNSDATEGLRDATAAVAERRNLECCVSFSDALKQQDQPMESPAVSNAASSTAAETQSLSFKLLQSAPQPTAREHRRVGGVGANASDGGAAISLHEGMGIAPVRPHGHSPEAGDDGAGRYGGELAAVDEGEGNLVERDGPVSTAGGEGGEAAGEEYVGQGTGGGVSVVGAGAASSAPTDSAGGSPGGEVIASADATGPAVGGAGGSTTLHSQYYYQQYAYLYQYAVGQGYSETDAVAYAQYYAAVYAQQYEAQTPEGQVGGDVAAAAGAGADAAASAHAEEQQRSQPVMTGSSIDAVGADGAAAATGTASALEAVGGAADPSWQVAAAAAEDEASAVVLGLTSPESNIFEVENVDRGEDPVYMTVPPAMHSAFPVAPVVAGPAVPEPVVEVEEGALLITAAPLPAELTAAATAAAQHHQSAVTTAVAAAAAVAYEQHKLQRTGGLTGVGDGTGAAAGAAPAATGAASVQAASAAASPLATQLLLGLGAAGAKRLTQLSSAATAAVASLGATVASTTPVAAALSAAAVAAGGFVGLDGLNGLSEDDFERIMHPGDPAKLDGPLPWELPEHLRTSRKFLALCANWQMANPGQAYSPHLLLQQLGQEQNKQQQRMSQQIAELEAPGVAAADVAMAEVNGGDVALAADVASVSAASEQQSAAADLSSYERACRLAQFGQPVVGLLPKKEATQAADSAMAVAAERFLDPQLPPQPHEQLPPLEQQQVQEPQSSETQPAASNGEVFIAASMPLSKRAPDASEAQEVEEQSPAAVAAPPAVCLDLGLLPVVDSPATDRCTPASERSDDPFAGTEHVPLSHQLQQLQQQQGSPQDSPTRVRHGGVTLEQVLELEGSCDASEAEVVASAAVEVAIEGSAGACSLLRLGTVEAVSFFDHLGEQLATPAGAKPEVTGDVAADGTADLERDMDAFATMGDEAAETATATQVALGEVDGALVANAAAAAIDSVVHALEQLRSSAAAGNGGPAVDPVVGTALLMQIQSSLAQATEALAGMGVDVSSLASLAAGARVQTPVTPGEWASSASHKRPRVDGSPSTPTRAAAAETATESVATPVLPPGPPVPRQAPEEAAAEGTGERFQQLGKRLSNASAGGPGPLAAQSNGAEAPLTPMSQQQQPSVVVSLTVTPAPEVDVAAVEARVRSEERAAWEARLDAVVDSERESAALVIAAVERERDGLQQRSGELEAALAGVTMEREALVGRLEAAEAECLRLRACSEEAETHREALAARLSEVTSERDALTAVLAAERSEKAVLLAALTTARSESEDLRRSYAARFSALSSELEATRGSLVALQGEHDELLLCLGQESTKVAVLTDALRDRGGDPDPLIEKIEAEYEAMELGGAGTGDEGEENGSEGYRAAGAEEDQEAAEGWEGEDLQL
ncbi:hypothetical protein VOLCADRAFT_107038 [Volvox carteri f. nagariensis]|uniref:Uncharacterized protein n=1 Tax=Volvox carteri f. nagariensis TaxID=3068 RepID=D8UBG3_VOLCA|nr:uncharacterized protein VOLCADRAFT_107038 [Volvox carteri f. nagariensis]EFJ42999.1 hypothetical protein VOLCADRAFT_107038 [Volvox carteri f. nagariensis]|eukprot:XP_002956039.1 hypothetical protein VOLCADRAFT_107038 [Volvox carteri f. nagariensis]